jgi:choline dehydrogenase-like flavoprotein
MKRAVVVGSGAGGAAAASGLAGRYSVTVLEAGREFRPFGARLRAVDAAKRAGFLFDVREIGLMFPAMKAFKAREGMVLVKGRGTGGTTTIAAGNALRLDRDLRELGVDLDDEFAALEREIPVTTAHRSRWRETTRALFDAMEHMGLGPRVMPKMGRYEDCTMCGRCVLGCPRGVKWDSRALLVRAVERGATLRTGVAAERVVVRGGEALGLEIRAGRRREFVSADLVVLAAGGFGTPPLLERSGIPCEPRLFVDPVLCVTAPWKGARQDRDLPMPFYVQKDGYILSPYFDHLSYFFNRDWRPPAGDILSLMIKLADEPVGNVGDRRVSKPLTGGDTERLAEAAGLCREVFGRLGVRADDLVFGTLNAGHPGGSLPLGPETAASLHDPRLPGNLYVADATLLPRALGAPPIMTIMALARKVARVCA